MTNLRIRKFTRKDAARELYDAYIDGKNAGMNAPVNESPPYCYWDRNVVSPNDFDVWVQNEGARGFAYGRAQRKRELRSVCGELDGGAA